MCEVMSLLVRVELPIEKVIYHRIKVRKMFGKGFSLNFLTNAFYLCYYYKSKIQQTKIAVTKISLSLQSRASV